MEAAIGKMFFAYGMTTIVSISVAVLIKLMTTALSSMQQSKTSARAGALTAGPVSPPSALVSVTTAGRDMDIAVITAAVYAVVGSMVRVVRIERNVLGTLWTASGRPVHQNSHIVTRRIS